MDEGVLFVISQGKDIDSVHVFRIEGGNRGIIVIFHAKDIDSVHLLRIEGDNRDIIFHVVAIQFDRSDQDCRSGNERNRDGSGFGLLGNDENRDGVCHDRASHAAGKEFHRSEFRFDGVVVFVIRLDRFDQDSRSGANGNERNRDFGRWLLNVVVASVERSVDLLGIEVKVADQSNQDKAVFFDDRGSFFDNGLFIIGLNQGRSGLDFFRLLLLRFVAIVEGRVDLLRIEVEIADLSDDDKARFLRSKVDWFGVDGIRRSEDGDRSGSGNVLVGGASRSHGARNAGFFSVDGFKSFLTEDKVDEQAAKGAHHQAGDSERGDELREGSVRHGCCCCFD